MRAGLVMVTLAAASWGTWSLFLRPTHLSAWVTSPLIFLVMGIVTLPFALRGPKSTWDRTTITLLLLNAGFDALNVITYFAAIDRTTVAIAVLTHYLAPILVALAAPRFEKLSTPGAGPAALVALVGLVIVLEPWRAAADGAVPGALLGVASAVCYAGNTFTVRRLGERIGAPRAMAYHSLIAAAVLAPLLIGHSEIEASDVALLAAGAITIGAGSGVVYIVGLTRIGAARAAVLTFAEPLVAVLVGALVWEEGLHPLAAVGGALVLGAGIYVARKARYHHEHAVAPGHESHDRDARLQ
ncbi:MAG: EamA family transporter [Deltaproteobacteria bacterium]|nr:EamA family transporter [Deltaproteobacteria bacterium]